MTARGRAVVANGGAKRVTDTRQIQLFLEFEQVTGQVRFGCRCRVNGCRRAGGVTRRFGKSAAGKGSSGMIRPHQTRKSLREHWHRLANVRFR